MFNTVLKVVLEKLPSSSTKTYELMIGERRSLQQEAIPKSNP